MIHEEILSLTNDQEKDKIYIAGHKGLIGSAILRKLILEGYKNIITIDKKNLILLINLKVNKFIKKQKQNSFLLLQQKLVEFFQIINLSTVLFENLMIQTNLINAAYNNGVKNLIFLGSSCIYPKFSKQPIKENYIY